MAMAFGILDRSFLKRIRIWFWIIQQCFLLSSKFKESALKLCWTVFSRCLEKYLSESKTSNFPLKSPRRTSNNNNKPTKPQHSPVVHRRCSFHELPKQPKSKPPTTHQLNAKFSQSCKVTNERRCNSPTTGATLLAAAVAQIQASYHRGLLVASCNGQRHANLIDL